jgi:hypothetical protein
MLLLAALTLSVVAQPPVDFTGTWKLDLSASDSLDAILEKQGVPWALRRAAGSLSTTQHIRHEGDVVVIRVVNAVRDKEERLPVGGDWEVKETDLGQARVRSAWSTDGKALVTTTETKLKDGTPARYLLTRTLADGGRTMVQLVEFHAGGKDLTARRVLRRQDP